MWKEVWRKGKNALGFFLDISSAFDSVSPEHVRDCLRQLGGDNDLVEWYYDYWKRRDLNFELHGTQHSVSTKIGLPQGGVCSAKFWLIAYDEAVRILNSGGVEGTAYADDSCTLITGKNLKSMVA